MPNPHKNLGLIAQEVQPVIQEAVYTDDSAGSDNSLSIAYTHLIPVLINDTIPASVLLAELDQWLRENQADLPPAVVDRWQAAAQQVDALLLEVLASRRSLDEAELAERNPSSFEQDRNQRNLDSVWPNTSVGSANFAGRAQPDRSRLNEGLSSLARQAA